MGASRDDSGAKGEAHEIHFTGDAAGALNLKLGLPPAMAKHILGHLESGANADRLPARSDRGAPLQPNPDGREAMQGRSTYGRFRGSDFHT